MWPSNQYTELSTNRSQFPNLTLSTFFQSTKQYHYYKRIQYFFSVENCIHKFILNKSITFRYFKFQNNLT